MNFDAQLAKNLASGDLIAVRATLMAIIEDDKNKKNPQALQDADTAAAELKSRGIELFVADDGYFSSTERSQWNVKFLNQIKEKIVWNFSREKIVLAQDVLLELRKSRQMPFPVEPAPTEPISNEHKKPINNRPEAKNRPIVMSSAQNSTSVLVGGALIVSGVVVGMVVAGAAGAIIGGGVGIFAATQIHNNHKRR